VPHSLISTVPERNSPTFWPLRPNDWTPMEFAIDLCEQENLALKNLVVSLSEIILKTMIGGK
jgi:hypothetical protein